jgi:TPR repeat protein
MRPQDDEEHAAQLLSAGDYPGALSLLRPLAEKNSGYALLSLGWIYETGAIGPPDKKAARTYYERASAAGSDAAYLYLGRLLLRDGQDKEALAAFEKGADLGNDECQSELERSAAEECAAEALKAGNYQEAERLLGPLAERNSKYALLSLGWICETGGTREPDLEAARRYYERAAAEGSPHAYFELGRLLLRQDDELQARSAFEAGAIKGDIPCMARLGRMMVEGRGGPADADAGAAWLERAAAQGHIPAQRTLLGIQEQQAESLLERLAIKGKILSLAVKGCKEMSKDPQSDKMR